MFLDLLFTTIILGLAGGITPGPIIVLSFSEILRSPEKGLVNGSLYLITAALTELVIGLFLIVTASWLMLPAFVFHLLTTIGALLLFYLSWCVLKIKTFAPGTTEKNIGIPHVIALMIFNGPMWLFWMSVCLPTALKFGKVIKNGEYLFAIIFEISMLLGLAIMVLSFNYFRNYFSNEKLIGKVFAVLAGLLFIIAAKMLYGEARYLMTLAGTAGVSPAWRVALLRDLVY